MGLPKIQYVERGAGGQFKNLTKKKWSEITSKENLYSAPKGFLIMFVFDNPEHFPLLDMSKQDVDEFEITVIADFKFNRLVNWRVQTIGVNQSNEFSFTDIGTAMWLALFKKFNYNPLMPLVNPPMRLRTYPNVTTNKLDIEPLARSSEHHTLMGEWNIYDVEPTTVGVLKKLSDEGYDFKDVLKVYEAIEYLQFVDWFNGRNTLQFLASKYALTDYEIWNNFLEMMNDKEYKAEVQSRADKLKQPLARNKYLKRYGSGNRGGYITDEGIDIWAKWIIFSGQDPELLNSVRYEVKR